MPATPGSPRWVASVRRLKAILTGLSFPESCAQVYLRLLIGGPLTRVQVRQLAALDDTTVFEATQTLRRSGLIVPFRIRDHDAWYCADPATAWLSMAAEATWSVSARISPIDKLPKTGIEAVDERSALCREAALAALRIWTGQIPDTDESRRARSADALAQMAVEAVRIAKTSVRAISASPKVSGAARFWPPLVIQMEAGVEYIRLADLNELYEHGLDIVRRDLQTGVRLSIGLQAELAPYRGYLADRKVLVRYAPAPPGERPKEGFMTSDKNAIARFRRRFDRLAQTTVPAEVAVVYLDLLADELRKKAASLSPDARDWLEELLRMGRFSKLPMERKWSDQRRGRTEEELVGSGLALCSVYGYFIASWPDADETTALLQLRHFG